MAISLQRVTFHVTLAQGGYILERNYFPASSESRELEDKIAKRVVCASKQTLQDELLKAITEVEDLAR
jgi:hypothetical protein